LLHAFISRLFILLTIALLVVSSGTSPLGLNAASEQARLLYQPALSAAPTASIPDDSAEASSPGPSLPAQDGATVLDTDPSLSPSEPPFSGINLYRPDAYSHQSTGQLCTGASTQMMINLVTGASDHSGQNQIDYVNYEMAHSHYTTIDVGGLPDGWAAALSAHGAGPYAVATYPSFEESMRAAATALRLTGRPVGLVIHHGGHAWVMAGFTSSGADPALSADFVLTGVVIMAPDYRTNIADPAPGTLMTMPALAALISPYTSTNFPTVWTGSYVVIEPQIFKPEPDPVLRP
jgi:hypothetical protein